MQELLRREISELGSYTLTHRSSRVKLNQNENPYELPGELKREILDRVAAMQWSRYPPFVPETQLKLLAEHTGWPAEGILLGNGSNDLLQLLFMGVLERGTGVVISQPTFTLYKLLARSLAANVREVPMQRPFAFDVERIIGEARASRARMIVLCTPNNPTGTVIGRQDVRRIVEATDALIVLDEAYVHFASGSMADLMHEYNRVVVLQTFSKAMGAASMRCGYGMMAPALARELTKIKLPYSVNIFTLTALEVILKRWSEVRAWIDVIVQDRERLRAAMDKLPGIRVHPSEANFLLFETLQKTPGEVFQLLLERDILIRDVSSYPMLERALRVSIGTRTENDAFLAALEEIL